MKYLKISIVFWNSLWFSVFIYSRSALTYVQKKILFQLGKKSTWHRKHKKGTGNQITEQKFKKHQTSLYNNSRSLRGDMEAEEILSSKILIDF